MGLPPLDRLTQPVFELDLPAGKTQLQTWLTDEKGDVRGAYYTEVESLAAGATVQ